MSTQPIIHSTSMWTKAFWKGAGERAIKTFAQSFLSVFGVGTVVEVTGSTLNTDTWLLALVSGAAAAALSVVMSVANPTFTAGDVVAEPFTAPAPEAALVPAGDGSHRASEEIADIDVSKLTDQGIWHTPDESTIVTDTTVQVDSPRES